MIAASSSGTQPPLGILVALPAMNARSMAMNTPNDTAIRHADHCHDVRATTAPSAVVIAIVPITAAP